MITAIRESADALIGIVDESLDFSQLQNGQVVLERVPFDMSVLIDGVAALMQPRAAAKGLVLDSEMKGFTNRRFIGDGGRIRQVLLNFTNNAIKFTESGSVLISAALVDASGQDSSPSLCPGHGPWHCGRVRFSESSRVTTRATRSLTVTPVGNGLGLAITKQIVDLMGGELGVESAVNEGTSFWAEIDLEPGPEDTLRVADSTGTGDLLIREGARVSDSRGQPD